VNILVANLGSTSFKYRLFAMDGPDERLLAEGGYERLRDHREAISGCLRTLVNDGVIEGDDDIEAVGFKTIMGKGVSGCVAADEGTLKALDGFREVAPAHNPAYREGIRLIRERLPKANLVALFETAYYTWAPEAWKHYAVPESWYLAGVRRYGFHGASHKYIAERSAELLHREDVLRRVRGLYVDGPGSFEGAPLRVISCHLGGSSSVTGILNGVAVGCSLGFSPQSGLPHNNRVGDLDSMALPYAMKELGLEVEEAQDQLSREAGLLGLSGVSNDVREIRAAESRGDQRASLAMQVLVHSIRHWIGAFMIELGGCDALIFTAGIGERDASLRTDVCHGLEEFGFLLDGEKNADAVGDEMIISREGSPVRIMVIPANEELVVARETQRFVDALNN
jgi:acetate kinase